MTDDAKERLRNQAVREAIARVASGDWTLTPSQLAVVRKMSLGRGTAVKASHTEVATVKNALRTLIQASKSQDLRLVLGLVQEAIGDLRSLEPSVGAKAEGETLTVQEAIKEIAKRQSAQEAALDQRERVVAKLLADTPLPQAPDPEKLSARAIRSAMKKIDSEARPDAKESPETARLRRKLAAELDRGKWR